MVADDWGEDTSCLSSIVIVRSKARHAEETQSASFETAFTSFRLPQDDMTGLSRSMTEMVDRSILGLE